MIWVSAFCSDEKMNNIIGSVKNKVKQSDFLDTFENCWKYFIGKVICMLKLSTTAKVQKREETDFHFIFPFKFQITLCFSPVGVTLCRRSRQFPALGYCTTINYFHEWPKTTSEIGCGESKMCDALCFARRKQIKKGNEKEIIHNSFIGGRLSWISFRIHGLMVCMLATYPWCQNCREHHPTILWIINCEKFRTNDEKKSACAKCMVNALVS